MKIYELPLFSRLRPSRATAAFCGLLFALTLNGSSFAADSGKNEPLAEVNGEVITAKELEGAPWREAVEARGADLRPQASGTGFPDHAEAVRAGGGKAKNIGRGVIGRGGDSQGSAGY